MVKLDMTSGLLHVLRGQRLMQDGLRGDARRTCMKIGRRTSDAASRFLRHKIRAEGSGESTGRLAGQVRRSYRVQHGRDSSQLLCGHFASWPSYWMGVNYGSVWELQGETTVRYATIGTQRVEIERHGPGWWRDPASGAAYFRSTRGKAGTHDEWVEGNTQPGKQAWPMLAPGARPMRPGYHFTKFWFALVQVQGAEETKRGWTATAARISE